MPFAPPLTGVAGTLPLPNTTPTPAAGELVRAEDVRQAAQGLLNQDATIARHLDGSAYLDIVYMNGRKRRRPRVPLTAADHTIDTTMGDSFQLASFAAGGPFVITLRTTTPPTPADGEIIRLYTSRNYAPSGLAWTIQREDGTDIATFVAKPSTDLMAVSAEFELVGGIWRLGLNSGWDSTALMGVHPEVGA